LFCELKTKVIAGLFQTVGDCQWLWYVAGAVAAMVVPISLTAYRCNYL